MRRIEQAARLMHAFSHCEPISILVRAWLEIDPQDDRDRLLQDAIAWAVSELTKMSALLIAHEVTPTPRRYEERVFALRDELFRTLESAAWCPVCAAEQAKQKPDLRVIRGGG